MEFLLNLPNKLHKSKISSEQWPLQQKYHTYNPVKFRIQHGANEEHWELYRIYRAIFQQFSIQEWKIAGIAVGVLYIALSIIHLLHVGIDVISKCKCDSFGAIVVILYVLWICAFLYGKFNRKSMERHRILERHPFKLRLKME